MQRVSGNSIPIFTPDLFVVPTKVANISAGFGRQIDSANEKILSDIDIGSNIWLRYKPHMKIIKLLESSSKYTCLSY